jgi:hypothetical protein
MTSNVMSRAALPVVSWFKGFTASENNSLTTDRLMLAKAAV